jgi:hypothetical protein
LKLKPEKNGRVCKETMRAYDMVSLSWRPLQDQSHRARRHADEVKAIEGMVGDLEFQVVPNHLEGWHRPPSKVWRQ